MFSADECFGGRHLNRGIELCAVVEQMYSLQALFRAFGETEFLDRCERIAYVEKKKEINKQSVVKERAGGPLS